MARVIAWLVLIFMVLFALRVIASRTTRARRKASVQNAVKPMVRCARCGVFLPREEAKENGGGFVCAGAGCVPHG
jgi:formylmethanofuran dehydrogenase subunit E